MTEQERLRLMEFMGCKIAAPDPENNANDCERLMLHMVEQDFAWCIEPWPDGTSVSLYETAQTIEGAELVAHGDFTDWKQGVCALALKAIGDE